MGEFNIDTYIVSALKLLRRTNIRIDPKAIIAVEENDYGDEKCIDLYLAGGYIVTITVKKDEVIAKVRFAEWCG